MSDKGSNMNRWNCSTGIEEDVDIMSGEEVEEELIEDGVRIGDLVPRGICDPIMTLTDYTDDVLLSLDTIKKNREARHTRAPPLRFYDTTTSGKPLSLDPSTESLRNQIWALWYDQGLSPNKMSEILHLGQARISRHLSVCKARYDEWIDQYGLSVYGNPAQRLDDLLKEFKSMLEELEEELLDGDISSKDKRELRKLKLELLDRVAKYQAIEPPKSIDITVRTPAEETRDKMVELFPDLDGVYK